MELTIQLMNVVITELYHNDEIYRYYPVNSFGFGKDAPHRGHERMRGLLEMLGKHPWFTDEKNVRPFPMECPTEYEIRNVHKISPELRWVIRKVYNLAVRVQTHDVPCEYEFKKVEKFIKKYL